MHLRFRQYEDAVESYKLFFRQRGFSWGHPVAFHKFGDYLTGQWTSLWIIQVERDFWFRGAWDAGRSAGGNQTVSIAAPRGPDHLRPQTAEEIEDFSVYINAPRVQWANPGMTDGFRLGTVRAEEGPFLFFVSDHRLWAEEQSELWFQKERGTNPNDNKKRSNDPPPYLLKLNGINRKGIERVIKEGKMKIEEGSILGNLGISLP